MNGGFINKGLFVNLAMVIGTEDIVSKNQHARSIICENIAAMFLQLFTV